ncbi:hypothetical protein HPG69_010109 [Diceros bicornis minor]|uniref:Uncharacterized protein n=1 Tax=Diceros bicornis minor TaxID=77932 RepID=A0A7J7FDQ1_DICBM|nr:hypothetical protein HPG69_010109 [Diceros bicornis minor]
MLREMSATLKIHLQRIS